MNSRFKDFYDIYELLSKYTFNGKELKIAIMETFNNRKTNYTDIVAFEDEFIMLPNTNKKWESLITKKEINLNMNFASIIENIKNFLVPITQSIICDSDFNYLWNNESKNWK